jgi:two-component system response regulator AtoC
MSAARRSLTLVEFPKPVAILIVNSDAHIRQLVEKSIPEHRRARVSLVFSNDLPPLAAATPPQVVLINLQTETQSPLTQLSLVFRQWPRAQVIFLSPIDSIDLWAEAIRLGAYDFLPKSIDPDQLQWVLQGALVKRQTGVTEGIGNRASSNAPNKRRAFGF